MMKQAELLEILRNGESSKVEFKLEDVHPGTLAEEIVAFANLEGGTILFGVDDHGTVAGCSRKDMEEFIVNVSRNNVRPSIIPVIEKVVLDDKTVFVTVIPRGDAAHTTNKGRYLIRVGSTKQVPTQQELLRLFQRKGMLQFDETPVLKASANSIDIQKVNRYLAMLEQSLLEDESENALERELLNLSILTETGQGIFPTLGGMLAFGKNPQKYFPSYTILCGAYQGEDFLSDAVREKELLGTLDQMIEDAVAFLKLTIAQSEIVENEIQKHTDYRYPIEALREGIVNAVCHRDYTIAGSAIRLFVFRDRLEIRSPGGLSNTLTLENMLYRQYTRNQVIASFLSGYGYMERRGKGLLRIIKLCRKKSISCQFWVSPDNSEFVVTYRPEESAASS